MQTKGNASAHTPGPWAVGDGYEVYAITAYRSVAMVLGDEHAKANSALIAAAPDLLEALERCVREMKGSISFTHEFDDAIEAARAALSKAKGA